MTFTIEKTDKNAHFLRIYNPSTLDKILVFPLSDIHFDSVKCNRKLLKEHLDYVLKNNGIIIINGDIFDLMQGAYDPRKSYSDVRPEYLHTSYIDAVIDDAVSFFMPYAKNIALVGYGNHETNIIKRLNTDPIMRFADKLNTLTGSKIAVGSYFGFITLLFNTDKVNDYGSKVICYHHGHGGNAKRSKGVLDHQLDGFQYPDADIIIKGHNHHKICDPSNVRWRLSAHGRVTTNCQTVIRLGTYKETEMGNGWEIEKGFFPSPQGSYYLWFSMFTKKVDKVVTRNVDYTVIEAK